MMERVFPHPTPPDAPSARPPTRLAWLGLILGLIALAPPGLSQTAPKVGVSPAMQGAIVESLRLTGTLTSPRVSRIAPEVAGRVAELRVDAGDRVEAGDTLLVLDRELTRLERDQAEAAQREAEAALADARRRLEEARNLAKRQSVAETRVKDLRAEVRQDQAILDRRRAELAYRQALLERHRLTAPFAGAVTERMTDLGEWVDSDEPVLEVVAVDRLRLDIQVPQTYFGRVNPGTEVTVRLDARPDSPLGATITERVPVTDPSARTFLARARLDNAAGQMAPGMSARATLRLATGRAGITVPRDAVIRYPDGRVTVWVVEPDTDPPTVSERPVETGLTQSERIEIRSGLEPGATVVTRGNETLQDGQTVRVVAND
jgi:RND family efflux transporter MFP subunit